MEENGAKECSKEALRELLGGYLEREASCKDMKNRRGWVGHLAKKPDGLIYLKTGEDGEVRLRNGYRLSVLTRDSNGFLETEFETELYADDIEEPKNPMKTPQIIYPKPKNIGDDVVRVPFGKLNELNGKGAMFLDSGGGWLKGGKMDVNDRENRQYYKGSDSVLRPLHIGSRVIIEGRIHIIVDDNPNLSEE